MDTIWLTVVVRAWRDNDGLKVRMHSTRSGSPEAVTVVQGTPEAACRQLMAWLLALDPVRRPSAGAPVDTGTRAETPRERGEDDAATPRKTTGP